MPASFAAIWDVDGTLVDTAELHFAAWKQLAEEIGRPFTRDDFAATFGMRNPEIIRQLFDPSADDSTVSRIGDRKEVIYRGAAAKSGITLLPGARSLLAGLHHRGWSQAIASSAPRANLELILELTGIRRFFQAIVAMEDTTRGKPDPEVFLLAAERLEVPPARCLVFEDAVAGVQAAKAARMKCVAVRFVGHHSAEKLTAANADLIVDSLELLSADNAERLVGDGNVHAERDS
jgi:beta-phosphoglucomutase